MTEHRPDGTISAGGDPPRDTAERLRLAREVADIQSWTIDVDSGTVTWTDDGAPPSDGHRPDTFDDIVEQVHPDARAEVKQTVEQAIDTGGEFEIDYPLAETAVDGAAWLSAAGTAITTEDGSVERVVGVTQDVTERKLAERRTRFLDELRQELQPLADPDDVIATASRLLGEHLEVDRCTYAEAEDDENYLIVDDHTRGDTASIAGEVAMADFGDEALRLMQENQAYIVDDVDADERITEADRDAYDRTDIQSLVAVPLHKDGRFTAKIAVHQKTPREWQPHEVELVRAVVGQCWESVQRTRSRHELEESQEWLQVFATASSDVVYRMSPDWTDMHQLEGQEFLADTTEPTSTWVDEYIPPEDQQQVWAAIDEAIQEQSLFEFEHRVVQADGTIGWTFSRAVPMLDEDGEISEWIGTATDITERKETEEELRKSRGKYRTLFDAMDEGFCMLELDWDENREISDLIFREVNPAFEEQTGLSDVVDKSVGELLPNFESYWMELYSQVARTGEPVRTENYVQDVDRWYNVFFSRLGTEESPHVAVVFDDITERKQREQRQEFLLEFSDTLRAQPDAEAKAQTALDLLADHLDLDRAYIATINNDEDRITIDSEYRRDDLASIVGEVPSADFPDAFRQAHDDTVVINNIADDPRLSARDRTSLDALDFTAFIAAGLRRDEGNLIWVLGGVSTDPHEWTSNEITLVEEVAERTWTTIERANAEAALREKEERLRAATNAADIGVWELDLQTNEGLSLSPRYAEILGYEEVPGNWSLEDALGHYQPDDQERLQQWLAEGLGERMFESRITRTDGDQRWISVGAERYTDSDGTPVRAVGTMQDITERKEREQRLARQHEQIEELKDRLIGISPTGILVVNEAGEITLANDRATDILGRSREDLVGLAHNALVFDIGDSNDDSILDERLPVEQVRATKDPIFGLELSATHGDGQRVWLSVNIAPLDSESTEPTETVVAFEEITELKHLNEALADLNDASRELMNVEREEITEQAVDTARTVLDVDYSALWVYDGEAGDLQRQTRSTTADIDLTTIHVPDDFDERAWQAFISDEIDVGTVLSPATDSPATTKSLQSDAIIPLGRHGIIYAGSTRPQTFDEATVDLAETVAATIETALDRDDDEQQLEAQNTELTQLNQVNDIIRAIDQGLVQAETREEIDRLVCERLAESDRYEFAWIGDLEPGAETVSPREWAGVDPGYLEGIEITTDDTPTGQGPVGTALRTGELQVVEDIVTDARFVPWRERTLAQDVRSCISVPLTYEDSLYGVLTVYAAQPLDSNRFGVLSELGETIGHAINAVETKRTLQTDSVVELGLQLREPNTVLWRLAQHASCTIEFEGLVPHADDPPTIFFTVHGASTDEIQRLSTDAIEIASVTCLREREDSCLCKARIGGPTLPAAFIDQEAVIRSLTIEETMVNAVVELSQAAEVRAFIDAIQTQFPTTKLVSRQTRERSLAGGEVGQTAFEEGLTARQQEILRTAYLSGYFQSPRETTGQEIAAALGVSQPTFIQHLRASQHNLLTTLFKELD